MEFTGICYGLDGGDGLTCRVLPTGSSLQIQAESGVFLGSLELAKIKASLTGMDDRYLCFEGPCGAKQLRVLVADRAIVSQLEALGATRLLLDQLASLGKHRQKKVTLGVAILGLLGALAAILALLAWALLGWTVNKAVELVPTDWEVQLGRAAAGQLLGPKQVCGDPELNKGLSEIGMRLIGGLGLSPYAFRFHVLDDPEVNAFALPGGYVFVNRGLIEQASDGNEVAGVVAHEIQHVLHRDGIHNVVHQAGLSLALSAIIGDLGAVQQVLMYNAASLASMSFNRDQESAADTAGLELMRRAGLDPTGLPRFLAKLAAKESALGGLVTMLSTHPGSSSRAADLQALIAAKGPAAIQPLIINWKNIQGRCAPQPLSDPDAI